MRPSGREDFLPLIGKGSRSVEEVAGEQHTGHENQEQAQIEARAVEFDREIVGIGIALHGSRLQRRMNCIAARAPRKNTVGIPKACTDSQRTVKIG